MLQYLLRLAGPKVAAMVALAVAKTVLSNRLARLQVWNLNDLMQSSSQLMRACEHKVSGCH